MRTTRHTKLIGVLTHPIGENLIHDMFSAAAEITGDDAAFFLFDAQAKEIGVAGYLPEALVNFVALLGWNPTADREIFTMIEMIEMFDLAKVNKAGAVFDVAKLGWINGMYLRQTPIEDLARKAMPILESAGYTDLDPDYVARVIDLVKERIHFLTDIPTFADYMFGPVREFDAEYAAKHWKPESAGQLEEISTRLEKLDAVEWTVDMIEATIRGYAEEVGLSAGKLIHPIRLALTGKRVGAGAFETMVVLGKETSIDRMREYAEKESGGVGEGGRG